ncbi:MAG: polyprenyl synthetase family protein [Methanocalculaceae archaeon]|jgi:geranylgeranyl diphosphate synthase type I|nr:polyprenyl synthetase family protein [Methanocalculaceae archaeon]
MELFEYLKAVAARIDHEADVYSKATDTTLQKASAHLLLGGGKRLRPAMVLLAADAVHKGASADIFSAALALEWTHTFTLVHDDIMDGDSLRRGRPTVHVQWDEPTAILAGDVLYARAFEYLCSVKNASPESKGEAVRMLAHACYEVCEGQQEDVSFETRNDVTIDEYLEMVRKKTGVLYAAAAGIGAALAGGNIKQISAFYMLGQSTGVAFQIQDDIIDLMMSSEVSGKDQASDLRKNKQTLLVITARGMGVDLSEYHKANLSKAEIAKAIRLLEDSGVLGKVRGMSETLIADAKTGLAAVVPDSEERKLIFEMVDFFITRGY